MTKLMAHVTTRVVLALGAALLVLIAVLVVLLTRSSTYEARVSLVASSTAGAGQTNSTDFGSVVALGLPAAVELANSPSVLATASQDVAGAPDPDTLAQDVVVEIVPASGLVRVTVSADDSGVASGLALSIARQVSAANLLAPSAELRLIDTRAEVHEVVPNPAYALGLAIVCGVVAGAVVYGALALLRPSPEGRINRALTRSRVGRPVTVVRTSADGELPAELALVAGTAGRAVRVVAGDPNAGDEVDGVRSGLGAAGVVTTHEAYPGSPTVVVVRRPVNTSSLTATLSALPSDADLVAVVLT